MYQQLVKYEPNSIIQLLGIVIVFSIFISCWGPCSSWGLKSQLEKSCQTAGPCWAWPWSSEAAAPIWVGLFWQRNPALNSPLSALWGLSAVPAPCRFEKSETTLGLHWPHSLSNFNTHFVQSKKGVLVYTVTSVSTYILHQGQSQLF